MNLVELQERLKDVPPQALMAYANGTNPLVPPYIALNELHRRKRMQDAANTPQMPQGTVKDEVTAQAMGLGGLMPGAQGMGAGALPGGGSLGSAGMMGGPRPPGMPGAPMGGPQPMPQPQNPNAQPNMRPPGPMMAAGGLVGLDPPLPDTMFSGGGLVAFAEGGPTDEDENGSSAPTLPSNPALVSPTINQAEARALLQDAIRRREEALRAFNENLGRSRQRLDSFNQSMQEKTPEQLMAERDAFMASRNAVHGVAPGPRGQQQLDDLQRLMQMQAAEDENVRKANERQRRIDLMTSLSQMQGYGRGVSGMARGLGSLGVALGPRLTQQERDAAMLRARPLQRETILMQMRSKIDELRRAEAEGDWKHVTQVQQQLQQLRRALVEASGRLESTATRQFGELATGAQSNAAQQAVTASQGVNSAVRESIRNQGSPRARAGAGSPADMQIKPAELARETETVATLYRTSEVDRANARATAVRTAVDALVSRGVSLEQAMQEVALQRLREARRTLSGLPAAAAAASTPTPSAAGASTSPGGPAVRPPPGAVRIEAVTPGS